jgi:hypothetical protein
VSRSPAHALALAVLAVALLLAVTYGYFGTRLLPELPLLVYTASLAAALAFVAIGSLDRRAGPVLGVVLLGALVFGFGVYGTGYGCTDRGYPADADYGVTYEAGELRFGEHVDGQDYRCSTDASPLVAGAGALLVFGGVLGAGRDWHVDPPWADR